jgi:hypothetical protein
MSSGLPAKIHRNRGVGERVARLQYSDVTARDAVDRVRSFLERTLGD